MPCYCRSLFLLICPLAVLLLSLSSTTTTTKVVDEEDAAVPSTIAATATFSTEGTQLVMGVINTPYTDCIRGYPFPPATTYTTDDQRHHADNDDHRYHNSNDDFTSCADAYYVEWLQAYGIRVIPIPWNATEGHLLYLLRRVNGVLFPGGSLSSYPDLLPQYLNYTSRIVHYAQDVNPNLLIWGTCLGFQMLSLILAGAHHEDSALLGCQYKGAWGKMMPLAFAVDERETTLFGPPPLSSSLSWSYAHFINALTHHNTTLNYHRCGITPEALTSSPAAEYITVLSTNTDTNGIPFVSSWESRKGALNMFAVQFHPERPPYEFDDDGISHTYETLDVSDYMARFIRERLQLNTQALGFDSVDELNALTTENNPRVYIGRGKAVYWLRV